MRRKKKILQVLLIVFIAIQFIQPARNVSGQRLSTDLTKTVAVPDKVLGILQKSCYDCHSNNTKYPWYAGIQPAAWLMASHIKEGKANLNFSEFEAYSNRKQQSKLQAIANSIKDKTMPLWSYSMIHKDTVLSQQNKALLLDWIQKTKDSIALKK